MTLNEDGSSYTGEKKEFLTGSPLNISAMRFGPDGAMYLVIGGRNTDSALYRVRYTGPTKRGPIRKLDKNQPLRDLRHSLEALHAPQDKPEAALKKAWPYLKHDDRAIRYAARLAIENQPLASWKDKALKEKDDRAAIYSLIALARHGDASSKADALNRLSKINVSKLPEDDQLALLRAYALSFIRLDPPSDEQAKAIISQVDPLYPASTDALNTELCRVLSYLQAPSVVKKTIGLMKQTTVKATNYDKEMLGRHEFGQVILKSQANSPNVQNIQYAYSLRVVKEGWDKAAREYFFNWLNDTLSKSGGKSFAGHVKAIRKEAIQLLPEEAAKEIEWLLGDIDVIDLADLPQAKGPAVNWTHAEAMKLFKDDLKGRDFENGKKMFSAGMCVACHRIQGEGGYSGPDLGSVGKRYSISDILTAIIDPSDSISEQYQASEVMDKAGTQHYGRLIYKDDKEVALAASAFKPGDLIKIPAGDVKSIKPSNLSLMPPATINSMNADELKDLMAYLLSGGNKDHKAFKK